MGSPAGGVHKDWAKLKEQSKGEKKKRDLLMEPSVQGKQNRLPVQPYVYCKQQPVGLSSQPICNTFQIQMYVCNG